MTRSVFISYRREDSSGYAMAIYNELREHLDPDNMFMDVNAIEPGMDFVKAIESAVGRCDVLLALIGPHWLDSKEGTGSRLQFENDYVRTEIATALERDVRVIPVLVGGAIMPSPDNLPDDIIPLTRLNAIEIRHTHFDADVVSLISVLVKLTNPKQEQISSGSPVDRGREKSVEDTATDDEGSRKQQWMGRVGRVVTLLLFILLGFVFFIWIDDLRDSSGYSAVGEGHAMVLASVTAVLALFITTASARSGRRRWWMGMSLGMLAFAALGFGVAVWLGDWLSVSGDGPWFSARAVWIVGFLVIVGQALLRVRG